MHLTEEQLRIVRHTGGHARVSAVAGSGKTTTMVARIGHLLREGVTAEKMLVLMFNKSARDCFAESMAKNLAVLNCPLPEVRTFHSLGLRLVNSFTKRGALPAFQLVTEEHILERLARQVVNEVYRQHHEGWPSAEDLEEFLTFLDRVKATVAPAEKVLQSLALRASFAYFVSAFELFEKVRRERRIRFYADLIHEPLMAMLADPELAAWVADRVEHIIVDEYQDINEAQQQLLRILAGSRAKVMVVGDVDQCIYEWRGAQPEFITTRFQQDFPDPANYLLSYTFRYGHQLSLAANHLIANNRKRDRKFCISHPSTASTGIACLADTDRMQVGSKAKHPVLGVLADWQERGRSLGEAAVLVRLFAQSVPVELALLEAGIPYRLEGNNQVFDCPEVLALTGYLRLVLGTLADEAVSARQATIIAMLSQPHVGLKREELESLAAAIAADPPSAPSLISSWGGSELPPFVRIKLGETAENWRHLSRLSATGSAAALLKKIIHRLQLYEFYDSFSARGVTAENRVKTCQALIDFAASQRYSAPELLVRIAELRTVSEAGAEETLLITSVHRAKGLEWPLVILPGLEEGSFPVDREQQGETAELEDERRLFYVAMTRAIEEAVFIHPPDEGLQRSLQVGGSRPAKDSPASRFLYEANLGFSTRLGRRLTSNETDEPIEGEDLAIATEYLKRTGKSVKLSARRPGPANSPPVPTAARMLQAEDIKEGLRVLHPAFGAGTIIAIMDRKQGRLKVRFAEQGEMILLAAYARLQVL